MKIICIITLLMASISLFAADGKVTIKDYFDNPTQENIETLIQDSHKTLDSDKEDINAKMNLMYVHFYEAMKMINNLNQNADKLQAGQRFQLANMLLELGEYEESIAHYNALNEQAPNWSCPWRHKGEAYYNLEDYESAEKALFKAIETRIEHYDAYLWLAKTQYKLEKYAEALKTFERGMGYKGKDIEDPEEEFSSEEESFLKLKLYKANKKDCTDMKNKLKKKYPESEYWGK